VRAAALEPLEGFGPDQVLWRLAARLLDDPDPGIRASARIRVIASPESHPLALRSFRAWAGSSQRLLRLSGRLALALQGDREQAIDFCRELTDADTEWAQPLLWLWLRLPEPRPDPLELLTGAAPLAAVASAAADVLEQAGERLEWQGGRYVRGGH